jgi:hypothetical protein
MKTRYFIPVLAALILAIAGLAFAQDEWFDDGGYHQAVNWSSIKPVPDTNSVREPDVIYDDSGMHRLPEFQFASIPSYDAGRMGDLKLKSAVKLGGVVLQPGDYQVRHVNNGKTHYVEFSQIVETGIEQEGMSPYQEQVVARVKCMREPQSTLVARTELRPKTAGTTARLEIRGEKAVHLF